MLITGGASSTATSALRVVLVSDVSARILWLHLRNRAEPIDQGVRRHANGRHTAAAGVQEASQHHQPELARQDASQHHQWPLERMLRIAITCWAPRQVTGRDLDVWHAPGDAYGDLSLRLSDDPCIIFRPP